METPSELLARWANSKCKNISVGGLLARCPIAHKWKSPYRSLVIRETLFWRMHDLGQQAHLLFSNGHLLGARILLRSALETLGILIYLNQRTNAVISGSFSFFEFSRLTMHLMLGSRNNSTSHPAINILTILQKAEKSHSGLVSLHERLSESAHPNFDGVLYTYSASDPKKYETNFSNRWEQLFSKEQETAMLFVFTLFETEYNQVWSDLMLQLESWLRDNDATLESQKNGVPPFA
mgnify:CR=1 FL=1|jgi:hypothetical protein